MLFVKCFVIELTIATSTTLGQGRDELETFWTLHTSLTLSAVVSTQIISYTVVACSTKCRSMLKYENFKIVLSHENCACIFFF